MRTKQLNLPKHIGSAFSIMRMPSDERLSTAGEINSGRRSHCAEHISFECTTPLPSAQFRFMKLTR